MSTPYLIGAPLTSIAGSSFLYKAWEQNDAIRFGASGLLGNAIFFGLDKLLFPVILRTAVNLSASSRPAIITGSKWISNNAVSLSFFVAYMLDIAVQHFLNAWLVFGLETIGTRDLYISSLTSSYAAYFGTLCGSTVLQAYLLRNGISKSVAFWGTIALGSMVNYVVLTSMNAIQQSTNNSTPDDDHSAKRKSKGMPAMIFPRHQTMF